MIFFFLMIRPPPKSTLFPYPTPFRSVPGANAAQSRPYVLLLEAMHETGTAALGRFVRAGRESLCLVRAKDGALALETLFLAERSEEHTSELQSQSNLVCRLLLEKKEK